MDSGIFIQVKLGPLSDEISLNDFENIMNKKFNKEVKQIWKKQVS